MSEMEVARPEVVPESKKVNGPIPNRQNPSLPKSEGPSEKPTLGRLPARASRRRSLAGGDDDPAR